MSDWNPEEVKKALDTELTVEGIHSHREITARKLREAAPLTADSLIHLALFSTNETVRLRASTEILNRVYGKISDQGMRTAEDVGSVEEVVNDLYGAEPSPN